jgi:dienelactone hydrolase
MAANIHPDVRNLMPPLEPSRRELVVTALASGFALAVQPVTAQSVITTDSFDLVAGEIRIPTKDAPLMAFYGGKDRGSTPESIQQMRSALENSPFKYQLAVFPDAEHDFNAEDAGAAWSQTLGWFRQFGAA